MAINLVLELSPDGDGNSHIFYEWWGNCYRDGEIVQPIKANLLPYPAPHAVPKPHQEWALITEPGVTLALSRVWHKKLIAIYFKLRSREECNLANTEQNWEKFQIHKNKMPSCE